MMTLNERDLLAKLRKALVGIGEYIEKKKPKTLAEAEHMLAVIGVIANETLGAEAA